MSLTGLRHLNGLAMAQGPVTSSTSPLWSPYGPYAMNRNQFGGFYGEADGAVEPAPAPAEDEGMISKLTSGKTDIFGYAVPTLALVGIGAYFLFFHKKSPLTKMNPWRGQKYRHSLAAKLRWARKDGTKAEVKAIEEELADLAGLSLTAWKKRSKITKPKTKAKLQARSKRYYKSYALDGKRVKRKGVKRGGRVGQPDYQPVAMKKQYTTKKDKNGRIMYYIDGKRVKREVALQLPLAMNPRRRKNGTKKGQVRKTARRAYMKRNSAAQKRAQRNAAKAMKLSKQKGISLKAAWRQIR